MMTMTDPGKGKRNLMGVLEAFDDIINKAVNPEIRTSSGTVDDAFRLDSGFKAAAVGPRFFRVPLLDLAGLRVHDTDANSYDTFYERQDVTEMWNLIDNLPSKKVLSIQGQPGTGMSTALWRKVLEMAVSGDSVLWISLDRDGVPKSTVYFHGGYYAPFELEFSPQYIEELKIFLYNARIPLDTVVLDGYSAATKYLTMEIRKWAKRANTNPKSRAIFTSSTKVERLRRHENDHVTYHVVHSWTRDEFKAALYNNGNASPIYVACAQVFNRDYGLDGFNDDDDDGKEAGEEAKDDDETSPPAKKHKALSDDDFEELLRGRYDYSGGSARWMFNYSKEKIERQLRTYCNSITNRQSIMNGEIGPTSMPATNYFFGSSRKSNGEPEYFLVSRRAVEILSEKIKGSSFETLYRFADDLENPSFVRWIVEADFFHQIDEARKQSVAFCPLKLSARGAAFKPEAFRKWEHTRNKKLLSVLASQTAKEKTKSAAKERITDIASKLIPKTEGSSVVCKPATWNQRGYDAFFVELVGGKSICLRFVQVTKGGNHDLKAMYMYHTTKFFEEAGYDVESVEIAFLLTPKNSGDFELGAVTDIAFLSTYRVYGDSDQK